MNSRFIRKKMCNFLAWSIDIPYKEENLPSFLGSRNEQAIA